MIEKWHHEQRGSSVNSWLNSQHSFSFGDFYHADKMGYGVLRVLNQDLLQGGGGFAEHAHRNMEIVTYVSQGQLCHQDNMGNNRSLMQVICS